MYNNLYMDIPKLSMPTRSTFNNDTLETSNVRLMISASRGWHSNKLREVHLIYASQSKCFRECYL